MGARSQDNSDSSDVLSKVGKALNSYHAWKRQRPFAGSVLMVAAAVAILYGPVALLRYAFLPGSLLWAALTVGATLMAMGLIQLFAPRHALITGSIGIVLSLVSLIVALGGLGVGMLLGLAGSAMGVAWRAHEPGAGRVDKKAFAITYGASLAAMFFLCFLAGSGVVALAAAIPTPVTVTANQINASSLNLVPGVSGADNTTAVAVAQLSGSATNLNISKSVTLPTNQTVTFTFGTSPATATKFSGLTLDATSLAADTANFSGLIINAGGANGLGVSSGGTVLGSGKSASVNAGSPYLIVNSISVSGFNLSIH